MYKRATLTAFAVALLITACGGDDDAATDTEPPATEVATTPAPEPETTVPETTEAPTTTVPPCRPGAPRTSGGQYQVCNDDGVWADAPRPTTTTAPPTTTLPPVPFTEADFTIELIVTEDKCFNSAGANVTVEPSLTMLRTFTGTGLLIYEIHGGEHVETFNMELEDGSYTYRPETIQTPTCDHLLTAVPVRFIER